MLEALRSETRPYHERLERTLAVFERVRSVEDYRALLARFYGIYAPLEARLAPGAGAHAGRLRKTEALARDLRALGLRDEEIAALPRCEGLPRVDSRARLLGYMYVLEGASLGGRIVSRHVREALGVGPEEGGAFFAGYGERTGEMWREFAAALEAGDPRDEAEVVGAAVETFAAFEAWLAGAETKSAADYEK